MGHNSFGIEFCVTTFGESHGPAIGVVLDGLESGFPIDFPSVQKMMDRRRPGGNALGTKRDEKDNIEVLSGLFEGRTTGCPLAMLIRNTDQQSNDYSTIAHTFRPGHSDYTYQKKWGIRDYRGGGRSSGRETASRVAAGAIAMQILQGKGISIQAGTVQVGSIKAQERNWQVARENELSCPDMKAARLMEDLIGQVSQQKDSIGGVIECIATGVPSGLGEPVFDKLDAQLAKAMMSIGAVKGVEIGDGFEASCNRGSLNNDQMDSTGFLSNHAGGILGGISNGQDIVIRCAFKGTPSIAREQKTIDESGQEQNLSIQGRHDPCICPRAVVVVESMMAITLLDFYYQEFGRK